MLRMLLLAAVAVVSLVAAQEFGRTAVVFTDVKLDDKVAVNYLRYCGHYRLVIAVITCVDNVDGAHGDLRDFLDKVTDDKVAKGKTNEPYEPAMVIVMRVENPKRSSVRHEKNFLGSAIEALAFEDNIEHFFDETTTVDVDVFQIAPTPPENIIRLTKANNVQVRQYHLSYGYCSSQYDTSGCPDIQAQNDFLKGIGPWIRHVHVGARVVFCNNKQSFTEEHGSGSYQPYAVMKDLLPKEHLEADLQDTFLGDKLIYANNVLVSNGVPNSNTLFPDGEAETDENLHSLVLLARKNENDPSLGRQGSELRKHFLAFLDEAIPVLERLSTWERCDTSLVQRLKQDVRPVFEADAEMQILISDGNQVAAVIDAMENGVATLESMKFVGNAHNKVCKLAPTNRDTADKMIYGASRERCLDRLRPTLLSQ